MDLKAKWIWAAGDPAPRNAVMCFRRVFTLKHKPVEAVTLSISADSRYVLFVNGKRLGYGPVRNYQYNYQYDTYNIQPYLKAGENVVGAMVMYWGESNFQHLAARAGLIVQIDGVLPDGESIFSDKEWHVKSSSAYRENVVRICCQLAWEEQFDARQENFSWTSAGFDDSQWLPAVEIGPVGVEPWTHLSPNKLPALSDEAIVPIHITTLGKARRPDLQVVAHATPYVVPGDLSSNRHQIDGLLATLIHAPKSGKVILRRNMPNLSPFEVYLDGQHIDWQKDYTGFSFTTKLTRGDHLLLIDLLGLAHDMDYTVTFNGMPGISASSPLGEGTWMAANQPGEEARKTAQVATQASQLLAMNVNWQPVAWQDTPEADIFMDINASIIKNPERGILTLPLAIPATEEPFERQYLLDFGRELAGWLEFEVEAPAGAEIDLLGFESFQYQKMMVSHSMNNTLRYTCREGKQTYTSIVWRGLRYLILAVHNAQSPVTIRRVVLHLATYSALPKGYFHSSDPRLNQIWEISANTLRLCSQDSYMDCPTYEQTMWVGDAAVDALINNVIYEDATFVERNLFLVADSLQRLPITNCQVPSGWESDLLPNWSWLWAMGCYNCYYFTGSLEFARKIYPSLVVQAEFIDKMRQNNPYGLFNFKGSWHLLDWAPLDIPDNGIIAHENALAVVSLRDTAKIAEVVGKPADAVRWNALADEIAHAIDRHFWSAEQRAFIDSIHEDGVLSTVVSQPTNVALLFSDVISPEHAAAISPFVVHAPAEWVPVGSPFMAYFTGEVLAKQGRYADLLSIVRDRWGEMLDVGATSTWETFRGFTEDIMLGMWTRSWCHAWSAAPAYFLSRFILGISPAEAGFKHALISPQLCDLSFVEGKMPTPFGLIEMRAEHQGSNSSLDLKLPAAVSATVSLTFNPEAKITLVGVSAKVQRQGEKVTIELPAGAQIKIECQEPLS